MPERTSLHTVHLEMGAQMVDFAGWDMPVHYGSLIGEHESVRRDAGMFDVSHMAAVDIGGTGAAAFLRGLLANDVAGRAEPGRAMYGCMLNEKGGIIDDLIVYGRAADRYRLVVNAGTRDKDLAWMRRQASTLSVEIDERRDLAMIAVQGPAAIDKTLPALPAGARDPVRALKRFQAAEYAEWFIGRTGYTGEDGLEIMLPAEKAPDFWRALHDRGVQPCGLGARDTLRLEAGMSLYGHDMDETTTPLESGLGWTVAWAPQEREFIGREALEAQRRAGVDRKMVGLLLEGRGVLREGQRLLSAAGDGVVTSGTFSPTLKRSIALARVPAAMEADCEVEIRGRRLPARVVKYPFVRAGKALIDLKNAE